MGPKMDRKCIMMVDKRMTVPVNAAILKLKCNTASRSSDINTKGEENGISQANIRLQIFCRKDCDTAL